MLVVAVFKVTFPLVEKKQLLDSVKHVHLVFLQFSYFFSLCACRHGLRFEEASFTLLTMCTVFCEETDVIITDKLLATLFILLCETYSSNISALFNFAPELFSNRLNEDKASMTEWKMCCCVSVMRFCRAQIYALLGV